jgi:Glycosyltransferase family 87
MSLTSKHPTAEPHVVLLAAVAAVVTLEAARGSGTLGTSETWPLLQTLVAGSALVAAWRQQERLRLAPLLAIALALELGFVVVHLALGVQSDFDSARVYPREGEALLHGHYPDTEYPPGAVLLFAFEALVSGGGSGVRVANAFTMIPFELAAVAAVFALRTRRSAWFAAILAVWPLNAFYWEFKYDAAPTAALVVGLVLAYRSRWTAAGVVLGIGAALKWTPGLAVLALGLWLLSRRQAREAVRHLAAAAGAFLLVNLPFLATSPGLVLHSYHVQASRGITGESFAYLVLRAAGRAAIPPNSAFYGPVVTPSWATTAAGALQVVAVLVVLALVLRCRTHVAATAAAGLAPVAFLLTTRTFSPQYFVTILAAWCVGGALVAATRLRQLLLALPMLGATLANVLVYPVVTPTYWWVCSWAAFLLGAVATAALLAEAA